MRICVLAVAILVGLSRVHAISSVGDAMRRTSARLNVVKQGGSNPLSNSTQDFASLYVEQVRASTEQSKLDSPLDPHMLNDIAQNAKQEAAAELNAYIAAEAAGRAGGAVPNVELNKTSEELTDASHRSQERIANGTVDTVQSAITGLKFLDHAEALGGNLLSASGDVFDESVQPYVDSASVNAAVSEYQSLNAEADAAEMKAQALLDEAMIARKAADQAAEDYQKLMVVADRAVEQARLQQSASTDQLHDVVQNAVTDVEASTKRIMDVVGARILDISGNQILNH